LIDIGITLSMFTYLFMSRNLSLTVLNIFATVGFLFLFIGIWVFARYLLMVCNVEESARKGSQNRDLISFTRSARHFTVYGIFTNLIFGAFLAAVAALVGSFSSLGRITTGRIETILMIIFSLALFMIIYKMIDLLSSEER